MKNISENLFICFLYLLIFITGIDLEAQHHSTSNDSEETILKSFHGWWRAITSGNVSGFNPNFSSNVTDVDQYFFIDTTTCPYITIKTLFGTLKYPRYPNNLDPNVASDDLYFLATSTGLPNSRYSLVQINDLNGPLPDPTVHYSVPTLTLQHDGLLASIPYSQPYYGGTFDGGMNIMLYKKIDAPPPIRPFNIKDLAFPNYNDPYELAKYIKSLWETLLNRNTNIHQKDPDYVGYAKEKKIFQKFFKTGFKKTTPIRQIRVSTPFPNPLGYTDKLTDIYTGDPKCNTGEFSYATPGATVKIKGLKGVLASLNGTYVNGVAVQEGGGYPHPNPSFVDSGPNGSFNDIYNHFLLNFDSSAPLFQQIADPTTKFIKVNPGATVTVEHRFTSDMEYPAFFSAYRAMFYAIFKTSIHNFDLVYTPPGSTRMYNTWRELNEALANDMASTFVNYNRFGQPDPFTYYHNSQYVGNGGGLFHIYNASYNDPYQISPNLPQFNYHVVLGNYIIKPQNLYFAIQGTLEDDQPDPSIFGYLPLISGPGRASFVSRIGPITVNQGIPTPNNPDPDHYTLLGAPYSLLKKSNDYFFGQIDPALTEGKIVGYLYLADCEFSDPLNLMSTGIYSPDSPLNPGPRSSREAFSQVYSTIMQYFNSIGCESIIIDIRANNGGSGFNPLALAEFFGEDRTFGKYYSQKADKGFSHLIDPVKYDTYNDFGSKYEDLQSHCYVSLNASRYPNSVFKGTSSHPKQLIIVDDLWAASAGDIFPWPFLGGKVNKDIGGHVKVSIIGSLDGRCKDNNFGITSLPVNAPPNAYLTNSSGEPVSPFQYIMGFPDFVFKVGPYFYNQFPPGLAVNKAPTLRGTAGNKPLPMSFQTTVYYDFGFVVPHPDLPLCGWNRGNPIGQPNPNDQTTWRDRVLEQAILKAIGCSKKSSCQTHSITPTVHPDFIPFEVNHESRNLQKTSISSFPLLHSQQRVIKLRQEVQKIYKKKIESGEIQRDKNNFPQPTQTFQAFDIEDIMKTYY